MLNTKLNEDKYAYVEAYYSQAAESHKEQILRKVKNDLLLQGNNNLINKYLLIRNHGGQGRIRHFQRTEKKKKRQNLVNPGFISLKLPLRMKVKYKIN